jgi:hypothetical protein
MLGNQRVTKKRQTLPCVSPRGLFHNELLGVCPDSFSGNEVTAMPAITAKTAEYIDLLEEGDTDDKLRRISERDLIRKLNNFQLIDRVLRQKYEMTYEEFGRREMVKKLNYSFEAE